MQKINVIIPMAGEGRRFKEAGFKKPKPLIKVFNKTLIEIAVETLDIKEILKNFSYGNDSFKIVHRTTHLYSASIGFELEIGDVAPF